MCTCVSIVSALLLLYSDALHQDPEAAQLMQSLSYTIQNIHPASLFHRHARNILRVKTSTKLVRAMVNHHVESTMNAQGSNPEFDPE